MKKNVMLTFCMIAMTMCLSFRALTAQDVDRQSLRSGAIDSKVRTGVENQKNLDAYVKDQQRDLDNYKKDISERVNGLQTGSAEEKQAAIAKYIEEREALTTNNIEARTRELYKYSGEATPEMKQQIQSDRAAKEAFDQTPGGDREKFEGAGNAYASSMGYPKYGDLPQDPRFLEGQQKVTELENYKKDISERINGLQQGSAEEKQAAIAKAVEEKTREVYKFQGEPSEDIKQKMAVDNAVKQVYDGTPDYNPKYNEANQRLRDLENYKNEMTERINGLQEGSAEEKQAAIAKAVEEKTREVYQLQGAPIEAVNERMAKDRAEKPVMDVAPGSGAPINETKLNAITGSEGTLQNIKQMANTGAPEALSSETPPSESPATPTTEGEDASAETPGSTTASDALVAPTTEGEDASTDATVVSPQVDLNASPETNTTPTSSDAVETTSDAEENL